MRASLPAGNHAAKLGPVPVGEDDHLVGGGNGSGDPMLIAEV